MLLSGTSWVLIFAMKIVPTFLYKNILRFIRPFSNSFYNCLNPKAIKLVTRLRTGFSHSGERKFKCSFQNSLNPICRCSIDVELCIHFFLHCLLFQNEKCTLRITVKSIDNTFLDHSDLLLTQVLS